MTMDSKPPVAVMSGMGAIISGERVAAGEALTRLAQQPHLVCHAAFLVERLGLAAGANRAAIRAAREQRHCDVAELFAFACPARFATPTPAGLARSLALQPDDSDAETLTLIADDLLQRLANRHYPLIRETAETATFLARANWPWAKPVVAALLKANPKLDVGTFATGLNVWDRIDEWEEDGGRPPGRHEAIEPAEAQAFLGEILGLESEPRPAQKDYAAAATFAFAPRQRKDVNNILLAEAGTGLGKTLGYLAPAWLWARRNNAPVWVSTYTKNLQRQLDQETARLVPDPDERRHRIVIRKGRENYVCLLNMQEAFGRLTSANPRSALLAALIARWARFTRDGDMVGGDFPSWILSLFGDLALDGESRGVSAASPTGAANASMPPARITAAASSSVRCAPGATPTS
jgi:ATP-dependent DNA helicase DinG